MNGGPHWRAHAVRLQKLMAAWIRIALIGLTVALAGCGKPSGEDLATAYMLAMPADPSGRQIERAVELFSPDAIWIDRNGQEHQGQQAIRDWLNTEPSQLYREWVGSPYSDGNAVLLDSLAWPLSQYRNGLVLTADAAARQRLAFTVNAGKIVEVRVSCLNC